MDAERIISQQFDDMVKAADMMPLMGDDVLSFFRRYIGGQIDLGLRIPMTKGVFM